MSIAYQGVAGAFGHEACLRFVPEERPHPLPSFHAVIAAVEQAEHDHGMLPFENRIAGPVVEVHSLLQQSALQVKSKHRLPVRLHLFGLPETSLEAITAVASHPVALAQCAASLETLGLTSEAAANTAVAAQDLIDPTKAVLASEAAGAIYGLKPLLFDLQDEPDNHTDFILVTRQASDEHQ